METLDVATNNHRHNFLLMMLLIIREGMILIVYIERVTTNNNVAQTYAIRIWSTLCRLVTRITFDDRRYPANQDNINA